MKFPEKFWGEDTHFGYVAARNLTTEQLAEALEKSDARRGQCSFLDLSPVYDSPVLLALYSGEAAEQVSEDADVIKAELMVILKEVATYVFNTTKAHEKSSN